MRRWVVGGLLLCLLGVGVGSAEPLRGANRSLPAVRTEQPPTIDGLLDDPCWEEAPTAADFIDSLLNRPAEDQTIARILYDDQAIYVAFEALDSQPEAIVARQRKDQVRFSGEDTVAFSIDPYRTHRWEDRSFFVVNPLGTKFARLAGGRAEKAEWIGLWEAAARRTQSGWTAEMRIPWEILDYPTSDQPITMAINFDRYQQRTGAHSWWSNVGRQEFYEHDGSWEGVQPPRARGEVRLMPYFYFGGHRGLEQRQLIGRAGVDLRYRTSRELTVLATVNPDFENVEQAVEGIDFSYGDRWVPERRPFFSEGSDFFPFWFYSRRVERLDVGVKAFGKLASGWNVGLLGTAQRNGPSVLVSRVQYAPSVKGDLAVAYGRRGAPGEVLHMLSLSGGARLTKAAFLGWDSLVSRQEGAEGRTTAARGGVYFHYSGDGFGMDLFGEHVDPNSPTQLSFLPFDAFRQAGGWFWIEPKWREGPVRSLVGWIGGEASNRLDGTVFRRRADFGLELHLRNDLGLSFSWDRERFEEHRRDGTVGAELRIRQSDRYTNAGIGGEIGRREDAPYRSFGVGGSLRVGNLNLGGRFQWVDHRTDEATGWVFQHIVTVGYDFSPALSLGGRLIWQRSGRNWYLALRRSGYSGADFYLILGDPNAEAFQRRLVGKVVLSL